MSIPKLKLNAESDEIIVGQQQIKITMEILPIKAQLKDTLVMYLKLNKALQ